MMDFFRGLGAHFRAIRLFATERNIRQKALAPLLVNILLFVVGIPLGIWLLFTIVFMPSIRDGYPSVLVTGLLFIATGFLALAGALLFFTLVGAIIAGPFSGPLSQAVERHRWQLLGKEPELPPNRGLVGDIWKSILYGLGRLVLFFLFYPLIALLQLFPPAGPILYLLLAFLYSAFVLSLDFSDPVLDRYLDTFRQKLAYIWKRRGLYLGFGSGAFLLMLIPFANLLVIPICVIGATLLHVDSTAKGQ